MPQKRNPMTCEYLIASVRLLRGSTSVLAGAAAHAEERDMSLWATEWIALPQALILMGGVADKLAHVLEGLEVSAERMRANLDRTRGLIMAEAAMMRLAAALGHEPAHELVSDAAKRAARDGRPLADVLADNAVVSARLSRRELGEALDPEAYLGLSGAFVDRVVARLTTR
jgi:3-carboxy-cis,cis-muconate cycloisomerase